MTLPHRTRTSQKGDVKDLWRRSDERTASAKTFEAIIDAPEAFGDVERPAAGLKNVSDPFEDDEFRSNFSLSVETLKVGKKK